MNQGWNRVGRRDGVVAAGPLGQPEELPDVADLTAEVLHPLLPRPLGSGTMLHGLAMSLPSSLAVRWWV